MRMTILGGITATATLASGFAAWAAFGGALLVAGAFVESLHDYETHLTVIGACCLAGAHLFRWTRHQQH